VRSREYAGITIIDTIILTNYTNNAYYYDTRCVEEGGSVRGQSLGKSDEGQALPTLPRHLLSLPGITYAI
jgi:hypothetical protein